MVILTILRDENGAYLWPWYEAFCDECKRTSQHNQLTREFVPYERTNAEEEPTSVQAEEVRAEMAYWKGMLHQAERKARQARSTNAALLFGGTGAIAEANTKRVHAVQRAVQAAARAGVRTEDLTLACLTVECRKCAHAVVGMGIARLVLPESALRQNSQLEWILVPVREAGIEVIFSEPVFGAAPVA